MPDARSVDEQLAALAEQPYYGKHSLSHAVWERLVSGEVPTPDTSMADAFKALHRVYLDDCAATAQHKNRLSLRQQTVVPYVRIDNISILYAKDGQVPPSIIENLADGVRSMHPSSPPVPVSGAETNVIGPDGPPAAADTNNHTGRRSARRQLAPPPPPAPVDPFDASLSVPRRLGGAHMPPATNLLPLIAARPDDEKAWAIADILCRVSVGAGFVSAFEVVRQILVPEVRDNPTSRYSYIAFLTKVQENPSAFQADVLNRCTWVNNRTNKTLWVTGHRYNNISAYVCIRENETMEIRRWPNTSASQQASSTFRSEMRANTLVPR